MFYLFMVMNFESLFDGAISSFEGLPLIYQNVFSVAFFMIIIFFYAIFIWKVHKAISRKDIISLNLKQYNSLEHPVMNKILAGLLYFIEYIIVLPFLVLFWYALFALALLFFSDNSLEQILLLSAAVVGSIRLLAYYNREISAEIAKLLPLTILGITLLSPKFLEIGRFADSFSQIPGLLLYVSYVLFFVVGLEIILRFLDLFKRIIVEE